MAETIDTQNDTIISTKLAQLTQPTKIYNTDHNKICYNRLNKKLSSHSRTMQGLASFEKHTQPWSVKFLPFDSRHLHRDENYIHPNRFYFCPHTPILIQFSFNAHLSPQEIYSIPPKINFIPTHPCNSNSISRPSLSIYCLVHVHYYKCPSHFTAN